MKQLTTLSVTFAIFLAAMVGHAVADNTKPGKGSGNSAAKGSATPPGLAKKPLGLPPGQAKKIYRSGEQLPSGYKWITDYGRWRLPTLLPGQGYVRYDNEVYRVYRDTAVVIEAIGIVSDLLR
ncbi:RcnB family protein [Ruegeria marina]|uniref:Regulator RcnB of Ni and Co efflux n=1 Tax=Ruegeria marina TaxID=639004 RepID=A0A1G7F6S7_9RHOB|nr:RcnB family protein [Ruegeria marina]SDE71648.1 hypothetical protein SAMN04488239_13017 [Ruegeria marina]